MKEIKINYVHFRNYPKQLEYNTYYLSSWERPLHITLFHNMLGYLTVP